MAHFEENVEDMVGTIRERRVVTESGGDETGDETDGSGDETGDKTSATAGDERDGVECKGAVHLTLTTIFCRC